MLQPSSSSSSSNVSSDTHDLPSSKRKRDNGSSVNNGLRKQPHRTAKSSSSSSSTAHDTIHNMLTKKHQLSVTKSHPRKQRRKGSTAVDHFTRTNNKIDNTHKDKDKKIQPASSLKQSTSPSPQQQSAPLLFHVGDRVEALKQMDDGTKEWYCARVVTIQQEDNGDTPWIFVHYEGWDASHADWVNHESIRCDGTMRLQYGPKGKESDASWKDYRTFYNSKEAEMYVKHHTGLVQDPRMLWHTCPCHSKRANHPERPERIGSILQALHVNRLLRFFQRIHAREATLEELALVHMHSHVRNYCPPIKHHSSSSPAPDIIESNASSPRTTSSTATTSTSSTHPPTSIQALLNPTTPSPATSRASSPTITIPSQPPSPSSPSKEKDLTSSPAVVRRTHGVEGGEVVKVDRNHIKQQQRKFSTAAAAAAAMNQDYHHLSDKTLNMVTPPGLIYQMTCGELGIAVDTPFHPLYSTISARVAAGALLELVDHVVEGTLHNGFALIRPPGHHAEDDGAMGFCFFNNVAVAVASTLRKHSDKIKKVLIIDWDIHHGNGTQKIFYDNPNVLYISLHRWENGNFYPFSGSPDECGQGEGLGRNVNIAFNTPDDKCKPMGDVELVAAFYHLVLPIARQFAPDMVFVSAGFDAAEGHPENIGGYQVTPRGFALLTKMTKELAEQVCDGRLVLSLEGGYELEPLAKSVAASVAQLLPAPLVPEDQLEYEESLNTIKPNRGAVDSLKRVANVQRHYWDLPEEFTSPEFRFMLPEEWRARDNFATRPRRSVKPVKPPRNIEGY